MSKNLVQQLNKMKHAGVNPREEWVQNHRSLLLSQIKNTLPAKAPKQPLENIWSGLSIFMPRALVYQVVRPLAVLLIVALVATRIVSDVDAAYEAVPGDLWYPAKIAAEKTQLTVASIIGDKNSQTKLHIKFAQNRASETTKILRANDPNKIAKVSATVANLKNEISNLNASLSSDASGGSSNLKADVVKDMHDTTAQIQNVLTDANKNLQGTVSTSPAVANEITATSNLIKDTSIKAVEVLVDKHLQGDTDVSSDDVNKAVSTTLDTIVNDAAQNKQNVDNAKNAVETVKSEVKDLAQTAGKAGENAATFASTTKALAQQLTTATDQAAKAVTASLEADKKVTEAKALLGSGDLAQAVDKIKEASLVTQALQKISDATLQKAQQVLPIVQVIKEAVTTTPATGVSATSSVITVTGTQLKAVFPTSTKSTTIIKK